MNVEFGKSVERDKVIFPIIYNRRNVDIHTHIHTYMPTHIHTYIHQYIHDIMREEYLNLQTVMKKPIMARPIIAYRKDSSLKDILISTRLPTNPVTL